MTIDRQTEAAAVLRLSAVPGLGRGGLLRLRARFGSFRAAAAADKAELSEVVGEKIAARISADSKVRTKEILSPYEKNRITLLPYGDEAYPPLLAEISDPPAMLFVRGNPDILSTDNGLCVVGSRAHSPYGCRAARSLSGEAARAGVVIISGLALGIDAIAHRAAVENSSPTVAVLGSGVDNARICPRENFALAREICLGGGCLVSEYPIGTKAAAGTFPARNRIMAGLAKATLVVEAGERSGTLITAEKALEYNREVLAVPGDIFSPYSRGANDLIARGAKPVRSAADILEEFASRRAVEADTPLPEMNENERRVFDTLGEQPLPLEKIIPLSRLSAEEALAALSRLEIEGAVLRLEGGFFARK